MLLIDTNVVAYLLIAGNHTDAAQQLRRRDPDWRSEASLVIHQRARIFHRDQANEG